MGNIIDYLKEYSGKTFKQHPFTAVDALLLSQISYMKLENIVPADGFADLETIAKCPDADVMYTDRLYGDMYREIMGHIAGSRRYAGFEMGMFRETYSDIGEYQFAAVTIRMTDLGGAGSYFVSFRGTDERLAGWKEDLNLGYMDVIPSEKMALEYLEDLPGMLDASGEPKIRSLFAGGHSKGGALAVFAAVKAGEVLQQNISGVYSFDGVGLGDEFYQSEGYLRIRPLVTKIIPDESIVGMLFEDIGNCMIVESEAHGIKQHEYINWVVKNGKFVYCDELKPVAGLLVERINEWMESMDKEDREDFVDIIYGVILDCSPEDIYNLGDEIPSRIKSVIGSFRTMSKEERNEIKSALKKLL